MLRTRRSNKGRKGFAMIYVTFMGAFLLIPMAGLAIDFGMLYNIKARLQTAVDAAAIGAGYLLHASTDLTDPTQLSAITTAAQGFFNANYPTHYFGSTVSYYNAGVTSSTSGKTITVNATAHVPMLLMRVLGISNSTVAATAVSNVRFIAMMIVVDRSGSVVSEGAQTTIQNALSQFVATASTSYLVDGVDTVGMVSFGGTWRLDFSPNIHFQTASPNIQTAITNIPFDSNNSTNTAEGLYQAWEQLYQMNLPGSLNVIVLLTDGRPSSFTSYFTPTSGSTCSNKTQRGAAMDTYVSLGSYPFWPPPTSGSDTYGLLATQFTATPETSHLAANSTGCYYAANPYNNETSVGSDLNGNFPSSVGPVDLGSTVVPGFSTAGSGLSTLTGYYNTGSCTTISSPKCGRYASFNAADNMATLIRQDTTLKPMLFVIGLSYSGTSTEPLDPDWLARVANDPNYTVVTTDSDAGVVAGQKVYNSTQTPGMYCNSTTTTLNTCFQQVTSQLLRLIQ